MVLVQDRSNVGEPVPLRSDHVQIVEPPFESVMLPVIEALESAVVISNPQVALIPLKDTLGKMLAPLSQRRTEAEALMEKIIARTRTSAEIRFFMSIASFHVCLRAIQI